LTLGTTWANNGVMAFGFFAREWVRTCDACGYTWRVPRSIARRGIRGMSGISAGGQAISARYSPSGGGAFQSGIGARAELMEGFRLCAKCGTDDFSQRPVRRGEIVPGAVPPHP
jgi:predicted nucleic-acid-binding Zn-ribbon protein